MQQFSETGNAVMVFGLLAIVESFMVFDMVIHGLKDLLGYVPVGWIKKLVKWQMKGCAYFWFLVT